MAVAIDEKDLFDAMSALGANLANALAANDEAREQRKQEDEERRREEARRLHELRKLSSEYQKTRDFHIYQMEHFVGTYFDKCSAEVISSLEEDERMPSVINYRERYGALLATQDKALMLRRIKATIDKAESMLDETWDVQGAYTDMYARLIAALRKIEEIEVAQPKGDVEAQASITASEISAGDLSAVDNAFERMLASVLISDSHLLDEHASELALREELDEDVREARRMASEHSRQLAAEVAGAHIDVTGCEDDPVPVEIKERYSKETLKELVAEVRKSYARYFEVVNDNGLFAAFATEGGYGACNGFSYGFWWEDEHIWGNEFWGANPHRFDSGKDIPDVVVEDDGGDAPERALQRMREFNQLEYWGYLDDEFEDHVVAFWYGFKKLMVYVNGRCEIDSSAFEAQLTSIREDLCAKARVLGQLMDQRQVDKYVDEVADMIGKMLRASKC